MKKWLINDYFDLAAWYNVNEQFDSVNFIYQRLEGIIDYTTDNYLGDSQFIESFYHKTSQYDKAEKIAIAQLRYIKEYIGEETIDYSNALIDLCYIYLWLGKYGDAEKEIKSIINNQNIHSPIQYEACRILSTIYQLTDKYQEQIVVLHKQLDLADNHSDKTTIIKSIIHAYVMIDDLENAMLWNEHLLYEYKDMESYLEFEQQINMMTFNISNMIQSSFQLVKYYEGKYGENSPEYAIGLINFANALLFEYPTDSLSIYILTNKAYNILSSKTNHDEFDKYRLVISKAARNFRQIGKFDHAKNFYTMFGFDPFNPPQAPIGYYPELKPITRSVLFYYSDCLLLAEIIGESGNYAASIELVSFILNILQNDNSDSDLNKHIFLCLVELGRTHRREKNYEEMESVLLEALQFKKEITVSEAFLLSVVYCLLSDAYYTIGLFENASIMMSELIDVHCVDLFNKWLYLTESQREAYWSYTNIYFEYVAPPIYFKTNSEQATQEFYSLLLLAKGLLLNSSIALGDIIAESEDTQLIAKYNYLLSVHNHLDKIGYASDSLKQLKENLEYELIKESKSFGDYTKNLKLYWNDVQTKLSSNDIAIEFVDFFIPEKDSLMYAALILKKDWPAPKMIPLFEKKQFDILGSKSIKSEAIAKHIYNSEIGKAKEISALIWQPLSEYLDEGSNVYFSPSGVLHQLAIESLSLEDGRLASEKYNLYRLSSTKQLCYERPEKKYSKAVLYGGLKYDLEDEIMVAQSRAYTENRDHYSMRGFESDTAYRGSWGYLNGSKKEVENISSTLTKNGIKTVVFKEENGNEESFRTLSGEKYDIIHIATHGFFLPLQEARKKEYFTMMGDNSPVIDNSMNRSGLILSGGNKAWRGESIPDEVEDGVLTAQEITTLDLRGADLVVLSACETGLGEVSGEGVFGLQRAFKKAGAQTLIMTLWKVHDEATQLMMSEFYAHLVSGKSKREAFLKAQAAVKAKYKEPFYWAGFIMLD
ncbi:CHAT domain-containing protein [Bacteroidales bacterium OttesenSCG-928-B11]|nr:CHAT domain-containing protein [Bacteroidales bacterium OttesenSCG-928-B11]